MATRSALAASTVPALSRSKLRGVRAKLTPLILASATKQIAGAAKGLGDVLVKRGRPVEALARFETALKYAPNLRKRAR